MPLHSLSLASLSSIYPSKNKNPPSFPTSLPADSPFYIKFDTVRRQNLRYLKTLGVIDPQTKLYRLPSPDTLDKVLATVNFLKSKGFSDGDFSRLAFLCPQLFSPNFCISDIEPVFDFLAVDLSASAAESHGLILRCPRLLFSHVEYCLRPTLNFLKQLGMEKLNSPSNLNSHLLNTRVDKLRTKFNYLRSIGFSHDEAASVCVRMPAIFGYSADDNLQPKVEYLMEEMERSLDELKRFPQYFAFSLEKRIEPRHLHLKQRNVRIPLNRMLMWSDSRFYSKWK